MLHHTGDRNISLELKQYDQGLAKVWDAFCAESDDAWFWHTSGWLNYTLRYKPDLKTQNLSFLVYWNKRLIAVVPLTLESYDIEGNRVKEFTFGGWAIPAPALENSLSGTDREIIQRMIFEEIDRQAKERGAVYAHFRETPLSSRQLAKTEISNCLMKHGFLDVSLNTQLIDLRLSEEQLWDNLRRNHKRNIKKAESAGIVMQFFSKENITTEVFEEYVQMHRKAAGRKTRPDETFALMLEWLKQGYGFLAVAELNGRRIGFEYYTIYKNSAYGFSAANDPSLGNLPIRHLIEWRAILWMKQHQISFYEIGLQQYGPLLYDLPDKKQYDISHFKKGYGGFAVPWFMGEKFFNKEFFIVTYQKRIQSFAEAAVHFKEVSL